MKTISMRPVIILLLLALTGAGLAAAWLLAGLPALDELDQKLTPPSVRITDREGRLLYEMLPAEGGRNTVVPLDEIPPALVQATIATEDRNFYRHPGVDVTGIFRALWINLQGGEPLAGGSTITQQVARNLLLEADERAQRSLRRKLRESILAWQLSRKYSKNEILALYLNQMYYGGLAYGVEAAAQTYFASPVSELDLAECALLAGLPQSPALYNPFTDMEAARARQQVVLSLMESEGMISAEQRAQAEREPLILAEQPYPMEAPHFVMMVRAELDRLLAADQRRLDGLVVRTTLNLDWQHQAERAVRDQLERVREQAKNGTGHNVNNAALVAIDPRSGDVLALVGSPDYTDAAHAGAVNMAVAPRQPGSALKPLIYAAALDPARPQPWTAGTMILDVTTAFTTHEGRPYTPVNYDGLEHGPVLLRDALASSLNIPAVITLDHIGLQELFTFAGNLGISTLGDPNQADLSIALGGGEVRLIDLTAAYGAFANGGFRVEPALVLDITMHGGELLYTRPRTARTRVIDERAAWLISDILSDDHARLLGFGDNSVLRLDRPAAVKTGTTTNFHDNWTVGYTPSLVVGVWAGNTSHEAMRDITGLTGAAPVWHQFMRAVLAGTPEEEFQRPGGLTLASICALSGKRLNDICPVPRREWFIDGTQPQDPDDFYRVVELDSGTGRLTTADTPAERRITDLALDLPVRAQPWARRTGLHLYSDLLPESESTGEVLRLSSPPAGAVFRLAGNIPAASQQIMLEAAGEPALLRVTFYVDGMRAGEVEQAPFRLWLQLTPGEHLAWVEGVDRQGGRARSQPVRFIVLSSGK